MLIFQTRHICLLLLTICCLVLSACVPQADIASSNNVSYNQIPEPYKLAIKDINNQNHDSALRYLDFTIKDFPDSIYVNNAHFLKCIILRGKLVSSIEITNNLNSGVDVMSASYLSEDDLDDLNLLKSYFQTIQKEQGDIREQYYDEIIFSIDLLEQDELSFKNIKSYPVGDIKKPFEWFKKFGYPVPTLNEFNAEKLEFEKKMIILFINQIIKNESIDFPLYYYSLLLSSYSLDFEKDTQRLLADKILQLTENDKYNEYRLETQDFINKT